jgi:phosphoribosylamine--glycine ligase
MGAARVLVVGSGGREHALAWRLEQDGVDVIVAPGNGGTPASAPIAATDIDALLELAGRVQLDLTVVGPEAPLAAGLVDRFQAAGQRVFGPSRAAARLEWSKAWAKSFLWRHGIPTASAEIVQGIAEARRAVARVGLPVVLKADGLAAGKGVFVCPTSEDLDRALESLFERRTVGAAADRVLVEECLQGPELSVQAFVDGERLAMVPPARDYKRLLDDDGGPNTGGMGGVGWPAYAGPAVLDEVKRRVLAPALAGMAREGESYRGVLYAGLMLTTDGPKVLEFNCRFGDPECQLVMPLLRSNLFETCMEVAAGELRPESVCWSEQPTYGVVLAARGYPEAPRSGDVLHGLDAVPAGVQVFHAGTRRDRATGEVVTVGGRVLTLVGQDRQAVYRAADLVQFPGKQFRRDIGREQ